MSYYFIYLFNSPLMSFLNLANSVDKNNSIASSACSFEIKRAPIEITFASLCFLPRVINSKIFSVIYYCSHTFNSICNSIKIGEAACTDNQMKKVKRQDCLKISHHHLRTTQNKTNCNPTNNEDSISDLVVDVLAEVFVSFFCWWDYS